MRRIIFIMALFVGFLNIESRGSNVLIDSMPLLRAAGGDAQILFNISWDHSWKMGKPYENWDAVWVFAKFKDASGLWKPVYFKSSGHSVEQNKGVVPKFTVGISNLSGGTTVNVGIFISRDEIGSGPIDWRNVNLLWDYKTQTNTSLDNIKIDVFALEMVYIPQNPFYLGSGSTTENAAFCYADGSGPYLIESEEPILLSNDASKGKLALGSKTGATANWVSTGSEISEGAVLPASFPKGYKAFYAMKYELSQEAYKDFLNFLDENQQLARTRLASLAAGENMYIFPTPSNAMNYRNGIMLAKIGGEYKFVCNYKKDAEMSLEDDADRPNDGQNIAMNYLSLDDCLAYLDWAGLRPLSELEFEKMARGKAMPKPNEYAWGTTYQLSCGNPDQLAYMAGTGKELPNAGNYNTSGYPLRAGAFANEKSLRSTSGAGYYGNMELCGNVSERYINISYPNAHTFTATHGDGLLETDGAASVGELIWPILPQHYIYRGGGGSSAANWANVNYTRTSDRYFYLTGRTLTSSDNNAGCRGGRTAP